MVSPFSMKRVICKADNRFQESFKLLNTVWKISINQEDRYLDPLNCFLGLVQSIYFGGIIFTNELSAAQIS